MCSSLSVRPVDQQRQLAVRFCSKWYCAKSVVGVFARKIRLAMNRILNYMPLFFQVWEQTLVSFCWNIFNSKSYSITDVSVTYKKHIGWWVALQNRVMETWDSRVAKGNITNHDYMHPLGPYAHIYNCMPVDRQANTCQT